MKEKCKLCGKLADPFKGGINNVTICKLCFYFLLEKYKDMNKIKEALKKYGVNKE